MTVYFSENLVNVLFNFLLMLVVLSFDFNSSLFLVLDDKFCLFWINIFQKNIQYF